MSYRKAPWAAAAIVACALLAPVSLQAQGNYLDVYIAKVKPEKAFEAEAIAKRIADANRRNNGDHVIAAETVYGSQYTYVFVTQRDNYADIDKGGDAFMASLNKAFGKEGTQKLLADWNNCLASAGTQVRVRRPDLSSKMPADPQSFAKLIGETRVLRTFVVQVRPGHAAEFEALVKEIDLRADRMPNTQPVLVSQVVEGENDGAYYITFPRTSLGGFDKDVMLKDILGEEGMAKFQKAIADIEQHSESAIYRFRPDLSYPPDAIAQVAADYWNPKPVITAAKAKPKTPGGGEVTPAAAKSKEKPQN